MFCIIFSLNHTFFHNLKMLVKLRCFQKNRAQQSKYWRFKIRPNLFLNGPQHATCRSIPCKGPDKKGKGDNAILNWLCLLFLSPLYTFIALYLHMIYEGLGEKFEVNFVDMWCENKFLSCYWLAEQPCHVCFDMGTKDPHQPQRIYYWPSNWSF